MRLSDRKDLLFRIWRLLLEVAAFLMFQSEERARIPADVLDVIVNAIPNSIAATFLWSLISIAWAFAAVLFMGNEQVKIEKNEQETT